jgi:hypothetical protein
MSTQSTQGEGFQGLRVVAFESRFGSSMERLIANHGGVPSIAPALREIQLEENTAAFDFARSLLSGEIDMVIFLTGVGARTLARVIETKFDQEQFASALSRVTTVARDPKPDAALRDLGVRASVLVLAGQLIFADDGAPGLTVRDGSIRPGELKKMRTLSAGSARLLERVWRESTRTPAQSNAVSMS